MSKSAPTFESETCDWLDKNDAALYLQRKGFHTITVNTIVHASSRLKTLREGKRVGKSYFWHKDWLNEWVASL